MRAAFQDGPFGSSTPEGLPLCDFAALMIASSSGGKNSRVTIWAATGVRTGTIGRMENEPQRVKSLFEETSRKTFPRGSVLGLQRLEALFRHLPHLRVLVV
jgi:hypothetical protein